MDHTLLMFQTNPVFLAIRGKVETQICFLYVSSLQKSHTTLWLCRREEIMIEYIIEKAVKLISVLLLSKN